MKNLKKEKIFYYLGMLNERGIFYWNGEDDFVEKSYSLPMDKKTALFNFNKFFTNASFSFLFIIAEENNQPNQ